MVQVRQQTQVDAAVQRVLLTGNTPYGDGDIGMMPSCVCPAQNRRVESDCECNRAYAQRSYSPTSHNYK